VGLTTPPRLKNIVTKSEEVKTGPICQGRRRKGLKDLILGVKNWKKVALNIDEWAKLLKKARAHQGAVEPMMMMMLCRNVGHQSPSDAAQYSR
jgi:hypothetical protein